MQKTTLKIPQHLFSSSQDLRLDQIISKHPDAFQVGLSRSLVRKLIVAGAVYVNGKRVRVASRNLRGGEVVDIYFDPTKSKPILEVKDALSRFLPLRILYEDEALIVFDKPAGLPTQPTVDEARLNLFELAKKQVAEIFKGPQYLGLHHRLDRDTSGVLLFTRDKKYNAFIADQFKFHKCTKVYSAVVHGKLVKEQGRIENFLGESHQRSKQKKFSSVRTGGKKAITDFLVLASTPLYSLIEVKILTGRTHQIRVHFSEMGHPIVGDSLYANRTTNTIHPTQKPDRHLLHAQSLTIAHPITEKLIQFESPVPPEFRKWVMSK